MIHLYYGDGKGKTSAAIGLAIRALGTGKKVVLVQFLKNRPTGELEALSLLGEITVLRGQAGDRFSVAMTDHEKEETARIHNENLKTALEKAEADCDLLILDEATDALALGMLDEDLVRQCMLLSEKVEVELVLTGHVLIPWIYDRADYVTKMQKEKHPYDSGVQARKGIEY